MRGSAWETNFEKDFENADQSVDEIIKLVGGLKSLGSIWRYFWKLLKLLFNSKRELIDMCHFGQLDDQLDRQLLELILSLLIRSPHTRASLETFSIIDTVEAKEEIGKANMQSQFRSAKRALDRGHLSNHIYIFLVSQTKEFIFADGMLNSLTPSLVGSGLHGHALVPLTPNLCVYICTPTSMRSDINYGSLAVAPWIVDMANEITQIYAGKEIYFRKGKSKINPDFFDGDFKTIKYGKHNLFDHLNTLTGYGSQFRNLDGKLEYRQSWMKHFRD